MIVFIHLHIGNSYLVTKLAVDIAYVAAAGGTYGAIAALLVGAVEGAYSLVLSSVAGTSVELAGTYHSSPSGRLCVDLSPRSSSR